jgi:hypothetical protein
MPYDIIFWGKSSHSSAIFKMHKRVIRIIMGYRESCKELFMELKILTPSSLYIFALLLFVDNNRDYFVSSNVYHKINTRQRHDLHLSQVSVPCIIREFFIQAFKSCNSLPKATNISSKPKRFKIPLNTNCKRNNFTVLNDFSAKRNIQLFLCLFMLYSYIV